MTNRPNLRDSLFPLRSHDIFGYMIPGATLIILIYMFEFFWKNIFLGDGASPYFHTPVLTAVSLAPLTENWVFMLLYFFATLLVCYVAGHIVASVSVFCLDRVLISKGHGYPWRTLLEMPVKSGFQREVSAPFYKGLFFHVNFYLVSRYLDLVLGMQVWGFVATVAGYGLLFALAVKILASRFFHKRLPRVSARFWRSFAAPYTLLGNMVNRYTGSSRAFSADFVKRYKDSFRRVFGVTPEEATTGNYWFTSIYLKDRFPVLSGDLERWHNLYSFSRNLSGSCYLAFLYCFGALALQLEQLSVLTPYQATLTMTFPLLFMAAAIVLVVRFHYIFVTKHSRLLFRMFVYGTSR